MDKDWFEKMFEGDDQNDNWGHQYRATQQLRLETSYHILMKHLQKTHFKVADLCCGLGDFISKISQRSLYGYDISQTAIKKARKLYPNIEFHQNQLPHIPQKLDVIITLECLNYIDIKTAIQEIYTNLNQDGLFLVSIQEEYRSKLETIIKENFIILEKEHLYFGLFSKIEPKLLFYAKDLTYILERKKARNKFLLQRLLNSKLSIFIKAIMIIIKHLSLIILKSKFLTYLTTFARQKSHIIILGQKK